MSNCAGGLDQRGVELCRVVHWPLHEEMEKTRILNARSISHMDV
jgi:hypothetical protein